MDRLCYLPFEQQGPEVFHPLDFCVNRKELSCCAFCEATKCDDTDATHVSVSDRNWENLLHMLEKKNLKILFFNIIKIYTPTDVKLGESVANSPLLIPAPEPLAPALAGRSLLKGSPLNKSSPWEERECQS